MNRLEMVEEIAKRTGFTKAQTEMTIDTFIQVCKDEVGAGGTVEIRGFLSIEKKKCAARTVKTPYGETMEIPERMLVKAHVSKRWNGSK